MNTNPLIQLEQFGQSIWLDYIRRDLITSGELRKLIESDGISGMTTNPAIFEKAISGSHDYEQEIREMVKQDYDSKAIYEAVCIKDVKMAADENYKPDWNEADVKDFKNFMKFSERVFDIDGEYDGN